MAHVCNRAHHGGAHRHQQRTVFLPQTRHPCPSRHGNAKRTNTSFSRTLRKRQHSTPAVPAFGCICSCRSCPTPYSTFFGVNTNRTIQPRRLQNRTSSRHLGLRAGRVIARASRNCCWIPPGVSSGIFNLANSARYVHICIQMRIICRMSAHLKKQPARLNTGKSS